MVNRPVRLAGTDADSTVGICIGIGIGIATATETSTSTSTADEVLAAAEAAVHRAKRNGRNGYVTSGSRFALFGTSLRDPHAGGTARRPPRCTSPWQ